jgi:hypothetical protein
VLKSIVVFDKNHWLEFHKPNVVVNLAERTPFSKLLTTAQKPRMSFQLKAQGPKVPCQT